MTIVETSYGKLRGHRNTDLSIFKGIPFAEPPVGDRRWRAPQNKQPWPGIKDALEYGPCAIQSTIPGDIGELIGIATHTTSEDCLYLNIWTPQTDTQKRPVMVWIHGGGNTVGAGSQPRVNGEHLSRMGNVVIVTINYRLGALGFMHAPALGATGNEGLLDQVAALRWVRNEIAHFGGDPNNVTVFGQSAGGFDIAQLMAMPCAEGCFDKSIPMSGSITKQVSPDEGLRASSALFEMLGGLDKMRSVDAEKILKCQSKVPKARWAPTRDGSVLLEDAKTVLASGKHTKGMPLMIGHTRDESTLFTMFIERFRNMTRDELIKRASNHFGEEADTAIQCYEDDRQTHGLRNNPVDIWAAISTDSMFRLPAIRTAECHTEHTADVWMYRFDHESPAHDGMLQSCHSLDIPFVWGTYDLPQMRRFCGTGLHVSELSRQIMSAYLAFAHTGNPNNQSTPDWNRYEAKSRNTLLLNKEISIEKAPLDAIRSFWEEHNIS